MSFEVVVFTSTVLVRECGFLLFSSVPVWLVCTSQRVFYAPPGATHKVLTVRDYHTHPSTTAGHPETTLVFGPTVRTCARIVKR